MPLHSRKLIEKKQDDSGDVLNCGGRVDAVGLDELSRVDRKKLSSDEFHPLWPSIVRWEQPALAPVCCMATAAAVSAAASAALACAVLSCI